MEKPKKFIPEEKLLKLTNEKYQKIKVEDPELFKIVEDSIRYYDSIGNFLPHDTILDDLPSSEEIAKRYKELTKPYEPPTWGFKDIAVASTGIPEGIGIGLDNLKDFAGVVTNTDWKPYKDFSFEEKISGLIPDSLKPQTRDQYRLAEKLKVGSEFATSAPLGAPAGAALKVGAHVLKKIPGLKWAGNFLDILGRSAIEGAKYTVPNVTANALTGAYTEHVYQNTGSQANAAIAGTVAPAVLSSLIRKGSNPALMFGAKGIDLDKYNRAAELGMPAYLPFVSNENSAIHKAGNFSLGRSGKAGTKLVEGIKNWAQKILGHDEGITPQTVGERMTNLAHSGKKHFEGKQDLIENELIAGFPKGEFSLVPMTKTRETLNEMSAYPTQTVGQRLDDANPERGMQRYLGLSSRAGDDVSESTVFGQKGQFGQTLPGQVNENISKLNDEISIKALRGERQRLGEASKNPHKLTVNEDEKKIGTVYHSMTQDWDDAARNLGLGNIVERKNENWRTYSGNVKPFYNFVQENAANKSSLPGKVLQSDEATKDILNTVEVLQEAMPKEIGSLKAGIIANLGKKADGEWSLSHHIRVLKVMKNKKTEAYEKLFTNQQREDLDKAMPLLESISNSIKDANHSKTGDIIYDLNKLKLGLTGAGGVAGWLSQDEKDNQKGLSAVGAIVGFGLGHKSPQYLTRLMTNPKFIHWLAKGQAKFEGKSSSKWDEWAKAGEHWIGKRATNQLIYATSDKEKPEK